MSFVEEVYRVLKRSGIFIVTTPNRAYRLRPGQKPWNRFHVREYSACELENVLRSSFRDVHVWGIRGNEEVQRMEMENAQRALKIAPFEPLCRLIPYPLEGLVRILGRVRRGNKRSDSNRNFISRYGLGDYYVVRDNARESLDLLGISRK